MSVSIGVSESFSSSSFTTKFPFAKKCTGSLRDRQKRKPSTVSIGTNVCVPDGLRNSWKQIGCLSVACYLQALTGVVAELKWQVNRMQKLTSSDMDLLRAFRCAVQDRKGKKEKYSDAACRLLVSEGQDIDAAFLDPDEAEAW